MKATKVHGGIEFIHICVYLQISKAYWRIIIYTDMIFVQILFHLKSMSEFFGRIFILRNVTVQYMNSSAICAPEIIVSFSSPKFLKSFNKILLF